MSLEKKLQIPVRVRVNEYTTERVIVVEFEDLGIHHWVLGLCMLKEEVVDQLRVEPLDTKPHLLLRRAHQVPRGPTVSEWGPSEFTAYLSSVELDRWVHFFLLYLRDGFGEVDHLDVDTVPSTGSGRQTTLVLKVPHAAPPVSAEEAAQRLRM